MTLHSLEAMYQSCLRPTCVYWFPLSCFVCFSNDIFDYKKGEADKLKHMSNTYTVSEKLYKRKLDMSEINDYFYSLYE